MDLRYLPAELSLLSGQLTTLNLSRCRQLDTLAGVEQLTVLTSLDLSWCPALTSLEDITQLQRLTSLNVSGCNALTSLAGIEQLKALTSLKASYCLALIRLEGIEQLTALTSLDLSKCKALTSLSRLIHLKALSSLDVHGCSALTSLSSIEQLTALTSLSVSECQDLTNLSGIEQLKSLTSLSVIECKALTSLTGIEQLKALTSLSIIQCNALTSLAGIEQLKVLTSLSVIECKALSSLTGIEQLKALTSLSVIQCHAVTRLAGIKQLKTLTSLDVSRCDVLTSLADIKHLEALISLNASQCERLTSLSGIEQLTALTWLNLSGCRALTNLAGIERLTALTSLNLSKCSRLTSLGGTKQLTALTSLDMNWCQSLTTLTGIEKLTALTSLDVSGCRALTSLAGIEKLRQLESLDARQAAINDFEPLQQLCKAPVKLKLLYLSGNPLEERFNLQFAANENNLPAIRAFFHQQGTIPVTIRLPTKLLLLGNHAVGKSTLVSLLDNSVTCAGSTHILKVHPYGKCDQKDITAESLDLPAAMIYDFGGQDYYHGIYRIFMGQHGVRCLVWKTGADQNGRKPDVNGLENLNFDRSYWIGCLQHYQQKKASAEDNSTAQQHSPLLILQTHVDDGNYVPTHSNQIIRQHHFSLCAPLQEDDEKSISPEIKNYQRQEQFYQSSFNSFKLQLDYLIEQQQPELPQSQWYGEFLQHILQAHKTESYHAVPTSKLLALYKAKDAPDPEHELLEAALIQLHRQGLVLYYPSIDKYQVWLNPIAFVEYVHNKVLAKPMMCKQQGKVLQEDFEKLDIEPNVLKILKQEKVIFLHPYGGPDGTQPEIIVPNYLPLTDPSSPDYQLYTFALAARPALTLWFKQFLPLGLINQLICHFGLLPDYKKFWRDQILFTLEKQGQSGGSLVLIKLEFEPRLQLKIHLQNTNELQRQQHLAYLYYVLMALYYDTATVESCPKYQQSMASFRKTERVASENEEPEAEFQHNDDTLTLLYQKIYQEPAEDLCLSVDGDYFVSATELAGLTNQIVLSAHHVERPKDNQIVAASLFAPFMRQQPKKRLKVFISYAHEDLQHRQKLQQYLHPLVREHAIEHWHDSMIDAGKHWDQEIKRKLETADVAIVLVSQALLASDYVNTHEMPALLQRQGLNLLNIVPVLLESCMYERWQGAHLQFFPVVGRDDVTDDESQTKDAGLLAMEEWTFQGKAWKQVAGAIQALCDAS